MVQTSTSWGTGHPAADAAVSKSTASGSVVNGLPQPGSILRMAAAGYPGYLVPEIPPLGGAAADYSETGPGPSSASSAGGAARTAVADDEASLEEVRLGGARLPPQLALDKINTLQKHLVELQSEDPTRVFIVRKINGLGFRSQELLMQHYAQYGVVIRVMVSYSKVKPFRAARARPRIRPGSLGFVVMENAASVLAILAAGHEQLVSGCRIRVERFEHMKSYGSGSPDDECQSLDVLPELHGDGLSRGDLPSASLTQPTHVAAASYSGAISCPPALSSNMTCSSSSGPTAVRSPPPSLSSLPSVAPPLVDERLLGSSVPPELGRHSLMIDEYSMMMRSARMQLQVLCEQFRQVGQRPSLTQDGVTNTLETAKYIANTAANVAATVYAAQPRQQLADMPSEVDPIMEKLTQVIDQLAHINRQTDFLAATWPNGIKKENLQDLEAETLQWLASASAETPQTSPAVVHTNGISPGLPPAATMPQPMVPPVGTSAGAAWATCMAEASCPSPWTSGSGTTLAPPPALEAPPSLLPPAAPLPPTAGLPASLLNLPDIARALAALEAVTPLPVPPPAPAVFGCGAVEPQVHHLTSAAAAPPPGLRHSAAATMPLVSDSFTSESFAYDGSFGDARIRGVSETQSPSMHGGTSDMGGRRGGEGHEAIVELGSDRGPRWLAQQETRSTLGMHLTVLQSEDPLKVFIVRRISGMGFCSEEILAKHYSSYGEVARVLVAHSKVKPFRNSQSRVRPGSLGFLVMKTAASVELILAAGREQIVAGRVVLVGPFEQTTKPAEENRSVSTADSTSVGDGTHQALSGSSGGSHSMSGSSGSNGSSGSDKGSGSGGSRGKAGGDSGGSADSGGSDKGGTSGDGGEGDSGGGDSGGSDKGIGDNGEGGEAEEQGSTDSQLAESCSDAGSGTDGAASPPVSTKSKSAKPNGKSK